MLQYVKNLLPRLQQFSNTIDRLENFVDQPWILIDENGNRHTHIFQRDKSLIMSLNGKATVGTWTYVPAAKSLLIDRGTDKVLLNHAFINNGVMLLRMDGDQNNLWMLANERVIPDLDVMKYLKNILIRRLQLKQFVHNSKYYYFSDRNDGEINSTTTFYDDNLNQSMVTFTLTQDGKTYDISDGIVKSSYNAITLKTDRGEITIFCSGNEIAIGDLVYVANKNVGDGTYKVFNSSSIKSITVKLGSLTSFRKKISMVILLYIIFLVILVTVFILLSYYRD